MSCFKCFFMTLAFFVCVVASVAIPVWIDLVVNISPRSAWWMQRCTDDGVYYTLNNGVFVTTVAIELFVIVMSFVLGEQVLTKPPRR